MREFKTSDEFFDWYIPKIKEYVPNLEELVQNNKFDDIALNIPELSDSDVDYMFDRIKDISPIPDNVHLVYVPNYQTFACTFNTDKKRLEIIIPTYAYYMLSYPPVLRAGIQHEMGHILNRDLMVSIPNHSSCVNIAMDVRINAHINKDDLRDLYNAVYYFKVKDFIPLSPEYYYPKVGLPLVKTAYSWQVIHTFYHKHDRDKAKEPKTFIQDPKIGDIVKINETGDYGMVIAEENGEWVILPMTEKEVDEFFENMQ